LRQYPTDEALGFLFGVSDSTAGRDTPGAAPRKRLLALLKDTPELVVVIDSFEQRTQRPKRHQRAHYSGKNKTHTPGGQVAVESGRFVGVSDSVPGVSTDGAPSNVAASSSERVNAWNGHSRLRNRPIGLLCAPGFLWPRGAVGIV
jgi:hypothetical protein